MSKKFISSLEHCLIIRAKGLNGVRDNLASISNIGGIFLIVADQSSERCEAVGLHSFIAEGNQQLD